MQRVPDALDVPCPSAMMTTVTAGPHSVSGISVGGVYTSLAVPELGLLLDAGAPLRSLALADTILLSHGHVDHLGALPALLGIRSLVNKPPPRVVMPAEIEAELLSVLAGLSRLQRSPLEIEPIGLRPGDEISLRGDLRIRAVRTFHPVPSLGYVVIRRVAKLRPEFQGLPGPQIAALRRGGTEVTVYEDRPELAYATDTLISAFDHSPELYQAGTLIMECTFLDERKSLAAARARCHIHLDEIIARADQFANDHVVMMHFSQLYSPAEISGILDARLPPGLRHRIVAGAEIWTTLPDPARKRFTLARSRVVTVHSMECGQTVSSSLHGDDDHKRRLLELDCLISKEDDAAKRQLMRLEVADLERGLLHSQHPGVCWVGTGGYWHHAALSDVEVVKAR